MLTQVTNPMKDTQSDAMTTVEDGESAEDSSATHSLSSESSRAAADIHTKKE